jgi:transcriptional regulator with XRE-family HTH domain
MNAKSEKAAIQLNENELRAAAALQGLKTDAQIAKVIGISASQLWRATREPSDPNYNAPGQSFIAGVLKAFGEPFERFFFLNDDVTSS